MFALDTNTVAYFFKGMGKVAENMLQRAPDEIALPAIVLYELEVGVAKTRQAERRRRQLDELLASITVFEFGPAEARVTARLRAELEMSGAPIGPLDTLIAGTVLSRGATLVTRNLREFGRVPGLHVVDWFG